MSKNLTLVLLFLSMYLGHQSEIHANSCQQIFLNSRATIIPDIADKVLAVHLTDFFPADGIVRASPSNSGRFGVTLHFSLGQPVINHAFGSWSKRKYGVVTSLKNLEPQLLNLFPQDSFVLGDLQLSKDAVIFVPEGDPIPQIPIRVVSYNPNQKTLKESIDAFIKNSGSMVFAAEGPFGHSALSIDGKKIDPTEQLRSLFQDIHQRNPRLTSTTHDYTLWGYIDYKIIDLLATWLRLGSPKMVEDSHLLYHIIGIETTIPEIIKVARERNLSSEALTSLYAGLKNLKSYLYLLKLEWRLRKSNQKTILGTDFKENPNLHQQIISALETPETILPLLIANLKFLSSISNASSFKVPTLDPMSLLGHAKYATMDEFNSIIRDFAPNSQKDSPKRYHSAFAKKAFQLLMERKISYEEFTKYFLAHFAQLEPFSKENLISDFLNASFSAWPKISLEVARFFRSSEVQNIVSKGDYFQFYNRSARQLATMNYLFKSILKPEDLKFVKKEGRAGAWYKDESGRMWYLKRDEKYSELQTAAEVISSTILARFGYKVPYVQIITLNGIRYAAVEALPKGNTSMTLSEINSENVKPLRVFAAMLKDWDRVRSYNNFLYSSGRDEYAMFDFGGTLGARAMGDHKPGLIFSEAIGSFENTKNFAEIYDVFDVKSLPENHPWKNLNASDYNYAYQYLEMLTDADISIIVDSARYSRMSDANYMKESLMNRRNGLIEGLKKRF